MPPPPDDEQLNAEFDAALAGSSVNSQRATAIRALTPPEVLDEIQQRLARRHAAQRRPREQS